MARVLLAALVVVVLIMVSPAAAEGPAGSASGLTWKVQARPFRLSFNEDGRPLLRQALGEPGPGTRMSYRIVTGGGMHSLTNLVARRPISGGEEYRVATTEGSRIATVAVVRIKLGLRVTVRFTPSDSIVRTVYESFGALPTEHFLGSGERRDYVDLRSRIVPIKVWHPCGIAKPAPFFISSAGYGIRYLTDSVGRLAFGGIVDGPSCQLGTAPCEVAEARPIAQACFKAASLSYEIYAGTPASITRAYLARVGRPPMPPAAQFGVIKWRDRIQDQAEVDDDVSLFARHGLPLSWVLVDNPWEAVDCKGSLRFDHARFPDPKRMIDDLHRRQIRVMLWVSPLITVACGRELYPKGSRLGPDMDQTLDLTAPDVATVFEERIRQLVDLGIDGVKADRADEVDLEQLPVRAGSGAAWHNAYPRLYARSIMRVLHEHDERQFATMFRSGWVGSQHLVPGFWSGDLPSNFNGLENAIRSGQTASLAGYTAWGSDIGGYLALAPELTPESFVRWAQFGALSPIFQLGGPGKSNSLFSMGNAAIDGLRRASLLHYELFPYHWSLAQRAHERGEPPLRPLAFEFPSDERSWASSLEVMLGPSLLAAPVTVPGTRASVYLPPGSWTDVHSGITVNGRRTLVRDTPLLEFPLYLRDGAAIPFEPRSQRIWSQPWALNELSHPGRGGWLLGDRPAEGSARGLGTLSSSRTGSRLSVRLTGARPETSLLLLGSHPPSSISAAGRLLLRATSQAALRRMRQGWLAVRSPYRGTLVKLAPRSGHATVTVALR